MICEVCKKKGADVLQRIGHHWLCLACREKGSKMVKAAKQTRETASYYQATVRPERRGLEGGNK